MIHVNDDTKADLGIPSVTALIVGILCFVAIITANLYESKPRFNNVEAGCSTAPTIWRGEK